MSPAGPLPAGHREVPLARLLAMAYRQLVVALHERLAARGWGDVRPQYGYVLLACRDRPSTSGELAGFLGVSKQAASKLVDAMVGADLLERRTSVTDSRVTPLVLSARGRRLLRVVEAIYLELEQEWAEVIGRDQVEGLRTGLSGVLGAPHDGHLPAVRPVGTRGLA